MMITKINSSAQLNICLDIIHKSFQTVADELDLMQRMHRGQSSVHCYTLTDNVLSAAGGILAAVFILLFP